MRKPGLALAFGAWLCLGGYAVAPSSPSANDASTTVILLPDAEGKVGAVSVATPGATRQIDQAYAFTTVERGSALLSESAAMGAGRVNAEFGQLLMAEPLRPKTFTLFFLLDKTAFTEESKGQLPVVLEAVRETARARESAEIWVFGHADAIGTERRNATLSSARANAVAKILRDYAPAMNRLVVRGFGYRDPLVKAAQNTPEARNRRVEIVIP